tara:strand:+ start:232 stop:561 length:330 start_codon:yes stop_codon:yes gene_type:complete
MDEEEYNNYLVNKGIVRYKFVIMLFLLCLVIFHPESFDLVKKCTGVENVNVLLFMHSTLFSVIIYFMLVFLNESYIFSPCNIEIDMEDFIYYKKNIDNINIDDGPSIID